MGKLTGTGLKQYAKSLVGTPYFYGAKIQNGKLTEDFMERMHKLYPKVVTNSYMAKARKKKQVGKVNVDCSGVIAGYRGKNIGSAQLYSSAKKRLPIKDVKDFAVGTVLWKEGHVGVYIGLDKKGIPICIEAKGIDYGVIRSKVSSTNWKCGLTFSDIEYSYKKKVSGNSKGKNPYKKPTETLCYGDCGESVKWMQWELVEAGYSIDIDGKYGPETKKALKKFQRSAKLVVNCKCGKETRAALIADK